MAIRMRTTASVALLVLVAGCSNDRAPGTPPSPQLPTSPTPPPATGVQPVVTGISPRVGSDRGGGWGTVTGTGFQSGALLTLGSSTIRTYFQDSTTIRFSGSPANAVGVVDVVVTNPGGLSSTLPGGYEFASPATFDFSGDWIGYAGSEYEHEIRFAVRHGELVSLSCRGVPVVLPVRPEVRGHEFSVSGTGGVTMTGLLVSPVNAVGTLDVPACTAGRWWADKTRE